jgi:hypothetical protein
MKPAHFCALIGLLVGGLCANGVGATNELRRTGDPRLIDEGRFFETPPMAGPLQEAPPGLTKPRRN